MNKNLESRNPFILEKRKRTLCLARSSVFGDIEPTRKGFRKVWGSEGIVFANEVMSCS